MMRRDSDWEVRRRCGLGKAAWHLILGSVNWFTLTRPPWKGWDAQMAV